MDKAFYGVYDNIADTYEAVLHLIGTGHKKENIIVVMSPTVPVGQYRDLAKAKREIRQKSLLETVFPLCTFRPDTWEELSPDIQVLLKSHHNALEAGKIVLLLQTEA